jgi:hypothetical protein
MKNAITLIVNAAAGIVVGILMGTTLLEICIAAVAVITFLYAVKLIDFAIQKAVDKLIKMKGD